tara:strand:+ start:6053 stop:6349 length:297 start_codon:yes stop_codon:yes gene_type:complete
MELLYTNVNWLVIGIGAALSFALGGFWYWSKLFGPGWNKGSNISPTNGHPLPALIVQAMGTFLLAWLIGIAATAAVWWVAALIILAVANTLAGGCMFS